MTDLNKQELRRLAEAASPGPWRQCGADKDSKSCACGQIWSTSVDELVAEVFAGAEALGAPAAGAGCNARFIAKANPATILELLDQVEALSQDASRYRALREMNWCDGPLAVVADPYSRIKLGSDCPSHERLDQAVDSIMAKAASADAGVVDYE